MSKALEKEKAELSFPFTINIYWIESHLLWVGESEKEISNLHFLSAHREISKLFAS